MPGKTEAQNLAANVMAEMRGALTPERSKGILAAAFQTLLDERDELQRKLGECEQKQAPSYRRVRFRKGFR